MAERFEPLEIKTLRFERNGGYRLAVVGPWVFNYFEGPFDGHPLMYVFSVSAGLIHGKLFEIRMDGISRD